MEFSKRLFWHAIFFVLAFSLAACNQAGKTAAPQAKTTEITVSAAASLQDAFREIGEIYQKQTGVKVNFNFASSGVLQKQIEQGAPADVFASAGQEQMEALAERNLIAKETRQNFVRNELVLILPPGSEVPALTFGQYLERNGEKIAIGNPKIVPAGQYAEQSLTRLGVWEKLKPRLIFGEDVRQVLDYVARKEVGAGIVYASDAKTAENKVYQVASAPADSHEPILYPIAVIKTSRNQDAGQKFIEFVLSADGQQILQKHGFKTVNS